MNYLPSERKRQKRIERRIIGVALSFTSLLGFAGINYFPGCIQEQREREIRAFPQEDRERMREIHNIRMKYLDGMVGVDGLYRELNK